MISNYYQWGEGCEAWKITDTPELSVIKEKMPPGTSEKLHYHEMADQVFFILKGTAVFIIDEELKTVEENNFIRIEHGSKHKIMNNSDIPIEFLVISQPRAHGDRIEL